MPQRRVRDRLDNVGGHQGIHAEKPCESTSLAFAFDDVKNALPVTAVGVPGSRSAV
jgi:hypothetical protein